MTRTSEFRSNSDLLARYKTRVLYLSSGFTALLALPLAIVNLREGFPILSALIVALMGVLMINVVMIRAERNHPATMAVVLAVMIAILAYAIPVRGTYGVFWAFPEVLFMSFGLSRRLAMLYAGLLVLATFILSVYYLEAGFAFRALLALTATVVYTNIFLSLIDLLQSRLLEQNRRDPLTGALNRRTLNDRLGEAVDRKRRSNTPACVLMIDLDHFKSFNDRYGHAAGDRALKTVAQLIEDNARRLDKLFRLGGEEFLLFLPDTPQAGGELVGTKLLTLLSQNTFEDGCPITVSIGLSEIRPGEAVESWTERADAALYNAKQNGRNQISLA